MTGALQITAVLLLGACIACDTGCGTKSWTDCSGRQLSCQSDGARQVLASRYDRKRRCFSPGAQLSGVCALPVGCPGGGGELTCLARAGAVYSAFLEYGEQLSDSSWHHDSSVTDDSTLTDAERKGCDELRQTLGATPNWADAGAIVLESSLGVTTVVAPSCAN